MTKPITLEQLSELWRSEFVNEKVQLCILCGNTGIIDTTFSAISPAGIRAGGRVLCICPNGRAYKQAGVKP